MSDDENLKIVLERIEVQLQGDGSRIAGFVRTALELQTLPDPPPRTAEMICYCIREALISVTRASGYKIDLDDPAVVLQQLQLALDGFDRAVHAPGTDAQDAREDLGRAVQERLQDLRDREGLRGRQLMALIEGRWGVAPLQGESDIGIEFQALLKAVQGDAGLHGNSDMAVAGEYLNRCTTLLTRIFVAPDSRLPELERLAKIVDPTNQDLETMRVLTVGPHHLRFFFSRLASATWLEKLEPYLTRPSEDGEPWPVLAAFDCLKDEHSHDLANWLSQLIDSQLLNEAQAFFVCHAADRLGDNGTAILVKVLKRYPTYHRSTFVVIHHASERDSSLALTAEVADTALNNSSTLDTWTRREKVVKPLIAGTNLENWKDRASRIAPKFNRVPLDDRERTQQLGWGDGSIATLDQFPDHAGQFEILREALVGVIDSAAAQGAPTLTLLDAVSHMPPDLRSRFRTWILSIVLDIPRTVAMEELQQSIRTRRPSVDDSTLLDRMHEASPLNEQEVSSLRHALPPAPSIETVGEALAEGNDVPRAWRGVRAWSAILPEICLADWRQPLALIAGRYGGRVPHPPIEQPETMAELVSSTSPLDREQLNAQDPISAAGAVSRWRPDGSSFTHSARHLGRELQAAAQEKPRAWAERPLEVVAALHEPTYIGHYFTGLAAAAAEIEDEGASLIEAIGFARRHPWDAAVLGEDSYDFDFDWKPADASGIELIGRLAHANKDLGDQTEAAWRITFEALGLSDEHADASDDDDPLNTAINRPKTQALESLLELMGSAKRNNFGEIPTNAFDELTACLNLTGRDGEEHRAILARVVGFLHYIAEDWLEENRDLLFGADAPDDLGQRTVDLALKWGQRNRWLLEAYPQRCFAAVERDVENALRHVLLGYLTDADSFDLDAIEGELTRMGPAKVSDAGEAIARLLRGSEVEHGRVERGVAFWKGMLAAKLSPSSYFGFGWWTQVRSLEQVDWLVLMSETADKAGGNLDWAPKTAERVAEQPLTVEALKVLGVMTAGTKEVWERPMVARTAIQALQESQRTEQSEELVEAGAALRDRLLELGFFDAYGEG